MITRGAALSRNIALASPFVLELHHAQYREGDSAAFGAAIRSALEDFKW